MLWKITIAIIALVLFVITFRLLVLIFQDKRYRCEKCHSRWTIVVNRNKTFGLHRGVVVKRICLKCLHSEIIIDELTGYLKKGRTLQ